MLLLLLLKPQCIAKMHEANTAEYASPLPQSTHDFTLYTLPLSSSFYILSYDLFPPYSETTIFSFGTR
jgi:hypothetical protein